MKLIFLNICYDCTIATTKKSPAYYFPFIIGLFFLSLIIFSIYFNDRGFLHPEAKKYLFGFLDHRPLLQKIFDVKQNDWGAYQARELSYLFSIIDANFIKYSIRFGFPHFYSISYYIGLIIILSLSYKLCIKYLELKSPLVFALLGGLFLTAPSTFFSGFFLRPSKILIAVFFTLILYILLRILINPKSKILNTKQIKNSNYQNSKKFYILNLKNLDLFRISNLEFRISYLIILLSILMSLSDRQGYFFLLSLTFIFFLLFLLFQFSLNIAPWNRRQRWIKKIFVLFLISTILVTIYTYYIGPFLIKSFASQNVDFSYMKLDLKTWLRVDPKPEVPEMDKKIFSLSLDSSNLLLDTISNYFGNIHRFIVLGLFIFVIYLLFKNRLILLIFLTSIVLMLIMYFFMLVKHPPVTWPGVRHTYYHFPTNILILFFSSFILGKALALWPKIKSVVIVILTIMFILNLFALPNDYKIIKLAIGFHQHQYAQQLQRCLKDKNFPIYMIILPDQAETNEVQTICKQLREL